MAEWGSGTFTEGVYDKTVPGTYIVVRVNPNGTYEIDTRGYAAALVELPGGEDNSIITVTKEEFEKNSEKIFGVSADDEALLPVRELFCRAHTLYLYRLNSGGKQASGTAGKAKYSGTIGNNITVAVSNNANDESTFDVITYYNGEEKDKQNVPEVKEQEVILTKGQEKAGETVENASAAFDISKNTVKVTFSNVPEGYKHSVRVKGQIGSILAFVPGRFEESSSGLVHTISYYPGAPINGTMTVEAVLTKDKAQVVKSCTYTCVQQESNEKGADATQLIDNDYVIFNKTGILKETAGEVFKGGSLGTVKGANYLEAKDLLEAYHFNVLGIPTTDKATQDIFIEYVKNQRDVEGVKFQIVIPHSPQREQAINHEGVIEISPINTVDNAKYSDTGLTYWLTGAEAACPVESNLTGTVYNGEFDVEARVTRADQVSTIKNGQILFNKIGDSIVILRDINTLVDIPQNSKEKNADFKKNQTIRVLDGLCQETADCFNSFFVAAHLNNNEVNRAELKNQLIKIRQRYATIGAINGYDEALMQINPGEKLSDVIGSDGISVSGAMEFLYFTLNLVSE